MQHLARCVIPGQLLQALVLSIPINHVADQGVTKELKMDANLVCAPGVQISLYQGSVLQPLQHPITSVRLPPFFFIDSHAFSVGGMSGDSGPDIASVPRYLSAHDRVVNLFHFAARELSGQREVGLVILGYHQATARIFIEAMHNSRTSDPANPAELTAAMMQQC